MICFRPGLVGLLKLDTHILVKALQGLLTPRERRLNFGLEYEPLAAALEKLDIIPVNRQVCQSLSSLDFQSDPADEIIGATSLAYQIPLVTRDSRILASRIIRFP